MTLQRHLLRLLCVALLLVTLGSAAACGKKPETGDLTGVFMNVGKADAILLYTADTTVLIDTGYADSFSTVERVLKREGRRRIDYLILTHYDKDHIGGAPAVLDRFEVGEVLLPDFTTDSDAYIALTDALTRTSATVTRLRDPRTLPLADGCTARILPTQRTEVTDENNTSLITEVTYDGFGLLLLGDALKDRVEEYAAGMQGTYQVVKTPHHGDYFKALRNLLTQAGAKHAIACADGSEREVEEKYEDMCRELGITSFRTDAGEIRLTFSRDTGDYVLKQ
mgnify:FL=1